MAEIRFYHLQRQGLEEALPKLMEKVHQAGLRAIIKAENKALIDTLDKALWTYDANSFIPHDKDGCKHPAEQPVFLTATDENPNDANALVLINAASYEEIEKFDRCLYMFDGRDEVIVSQARTDWKAYKELGLEMSYWQQRENGGWEQKA
ncbi:DNA polymerase III subunit chi [Kordiimonas sp. SCSIO 12603]|uniref:DNA polymerase III subunit chi n=1 Tax=Kordiimonas sp. SCSIO 12603 TaxID=2829596 RepID=UPI0021070BD5|nr:DNA polymerase III subunit chi [Kordiimonas sp. SCSIO 12603]UTW57351.1 DNA polymerase III subunit chi [Kordiimonas sp. SCSIO 12603]